MTTETPLPVTGVIVAANLGDTNAFVAGFTLDGVVEDSGREFKGPRAIRTWCEDTFIGANVSLDVTSVDANGNGVVVVTADEAGNGFTGLSRYTFTIADDRISRMSRTAVNR